VGDLPEVWAWYFTDQITSDELPDLDQVEHPTAFDIYLGDQEVALWAQHRDAALQLIHSEDQIVHESTNAARSAPAT
jgi:hypothetical protein